MKLEFIADCFDDKISLRAGLSIANREDLPSIAKSTSGFAALISMNCIKYHNLIVSAHSTNRLGEQ
jgi:hypothetical protein